MNACIKCGSGYAIGFGKAHSPRKSAGRSASNTPAWVVTAPLSGGVNISSEQQVMSGRAAHAPIGSASLPQLRDGEVTGGPPGGGIGGGGGTGGGGDSHGSGGGSSSGPGPQWWLFCIQAAAAGWAAGCVVFEAGHILHRPEPAALSLPASAKMGLARKSVVQMQHDHFNMPWIWVLLAALGSLAVVLSKQREDPATDPFLVEEGEDEACEPAPVASEEHPHPDVDSLDPELQDASARPSSAASSDHADRDAVPSLDPELHTARTSVFAAATARAESAPLPELHVLTCPDNASFHELRRFWASGGTVSPRSPECGASPKQPGAQVFRPVYKRRASLDSHRNPLAARAQAEATTGPGCSVPKLVCDVRLASSRSHQDSDAMSWPSTPHTPDLKGGGRSLDLAAAGVDAPTASELVKGADEAADQSAGAEQHGSRSTGPASDTGVSKPRQTTPRQEFRNGSSAESRADSVADDADEADAASTEVATIDRFEESSQVSASEASCVAVSPRTDVDDASVDASRQEVEPERAASSIDNQEPSSPARSRVPTEDLDAGADEGDSLCSSPRDSHAEVKWAAAVATAEPPAKVAAGSWQEEGKTEDGTASTPTSPAAGSAVSGYAIADAAEEVAGADTKACSAFSFPDDDAQVQVPSTLNLRSLQHQAMGPTPKPIAVPDAPSESTDATSPRQAPLTERSCVKGGLDTTSSTVFPQNSWQIADDIEVDVGRNGGPQMPVASCSLDGDVDSAGTLSPQPVSASGHASDESFGSSGSPSFMSFPSEQNQVGVFQWN